MTEALPLKYLNVLEDVCILVPDASPQWYSGLMLPSMNSHSGTRAVTVTTVASCALTEMRHLSFCCQTSVECVNFVLRGMHTL
jgi:hypothetical protein